MRVLRAVITAGGTSEPIDDVRVVTNLSSGRLGAEIARALADSGVRTELITSGVAPPSDGRALKVVRTRTTADLQHAIDEATQSPVDVFFMAAAVSDYAPQVAEGKIRSDRDELLVRMGRTPKILPTLRNRCGPEAFLVGFKLLSGVPHEELVRVARGQIESCDTDACFANDLALIGPDHHPATLVLSDGGEIDLDGDKEAVARALVSRVLVRIDPMRRRRLAPLPPPPHVDFADPQDLQRARVVLKAALADSGIDPASADDPAAVPLRADGDLVGLIVTGPGGEAVPFVLPQHRSREIGDITADRLAEMGRMVLAPGADAQWWIDRGWRVEERLGSAVRLNPPGLRPPVDQGASVALIHGPTDRILLGKRLVEPAKGQWAFPGGRVEQDESPIDTALRELEEETGIHLVPPGDPEQVTEIHVPARAEGEVLRITNFLWTVPDAPEPGLSEELDAHWFPLADIGQVSPMVPGVRRVLRRWRSGGGR